MSGLVMRVWHEDREPFILQVWFGCESSGTWADYFFFFFNIMVGHKKWGGPLLGVTRSSSC